LALAYAWMPVRLYERPAPDEMFTMLPRRRAFIAGAAARVKWKAPSRLTAKIARQASSETSSTGFIV
jgi:hypothetical protein